MWSGIVNGCPVREGDNVTVGCYVQYNWLSHWALYNPSTAFNASIEFLEDPSTTRPLPIQSPHRSTTTYAIQNVSAGDVIQATCRIAFDSRDIKVSPNTYATNSLVHTSSVSQPVSCECSCTFYHRLHDTISISGGARVFAARGKGPWCRPANRQHPSSVHWMFVYLIVWCLTALSAELGYIVP